MSHNKGMSGQGPLKCFYSKFGAKRVLIKSIVDKQRSPHLSEVTGLILLPFLQESASM